MEIALESAIPTYSAGWGVLAGDTIRSAARSSAAHGGHLPAPTNGFRGIGILRILERIVELGGGHQLRASSAVARCSAAEPVRAPVVAKCSRAPTPDRAQGMEVLRCPAEG